MSEIKDEDNGPQEFRPPRVDAPGFIHNLKGGFMAHGRDFPACSVTGKPVTGAFATGFTIRGMAAKNGGKPKPFVVRAPGNFCCLAGAIKPAVETLGKAIVRGMGKDWDGSLVVVDFTWAYLPPPGEVLSDH